MSPQLQLRYKQLHGHDFEQLNPLGIGSIVGHSLSHLMGIVRIPDDYGFLETVELLHL